MRRAVRILKRTLVAFYDDQMTHHAAALTYYALMSLLPTMLLCVSLLGLLGQYPATYDAILDYLRDLVPQSTLGAVDAALRGALRSEGTAAGALAVSVLVALYGTTGLLEAARRALNVVFDARQGRSFLRRKATDVASTVVLVGLILVTLVFVFVGGGLARDIFDALGLGSTAVSAWRAARWPAAYLVATLVFAFLYYVTPDVKQRAFHWITPGAVVGVALWLLASIGFSLYLSHFTSFNATYGSLGAALVLVVWLWLTNVALLFGAELNAEIEREKELSEGVPASETLALRDLGR